jgi:hypothetical protein
VGSDLSPSHKRFACSGIVTDPRSHTVAGAAQAWAQLHAVPVSRFTRRQEAPADTLNECSDFTQYPGQAKSMSLRKRAGKRAGTGSRVPPAVARQRIDGIEILRAVNEIEWLVHHGKSIESYLLLLDLSRFLKL